MRIHAVLVVASAVIGACSLRGSLDGYMGAQCVAAEDCAAAITPCQAPTCVGGVCVTSFPEGNAIASQLAGDCRVEVCDGTGATVPTTDGSDVYDDGNACTADVCQDSTPANKPATGPCPLPAGGTGTCDVETGACVECVGEEKCTSSECTGECACDDGACHQAHCINDAPDVLEGETDVDCGGPCRGCATGQHCVKDADCGSNVCDGAACPAESPCCQPPSCDDEAQNGDESGVDCGGGCPGCPDDAHCQVPADCASKVCKKGVCQAPTCTDGTVNGGETDKDCGGPTSCPRCAPLQHCVVPGDCFGGQCREDQCDPTCADGFRSNGEVGVDCGGPCPACT